MRTALLLVAIALSGAPAVAAEGSDPFGRRGDPGFWLDGHLDLRYDYRLVEGDRERRRTDDQDLIQDLFLQGGKGSGLRFELSGRVREDIDGQRRNDIFRDVHDTFGDHARAYLYTAFVEALDVGPLARVRFGRQYYAEGVDVRFDGALLETRALGDAVKLVAYGGVPVHLYEASMRGDWLAGGAVELVAIPRTTVRFDYVHVTDERDDLDDAERFDGFERDPLRDDDLFALTVTHRIFRDLRARLRASTFEGKSSRFEGDLYYLATDWDLSARLRYVFQTGAYRDLSIQFTPLDEVLDEYEPYHEVYGDLRKGIGHHLSIGAGGAIRELRRERDEGPFNHEFRRVFGLVDVIDWPWVGLGISLLGEWYWSDQDDELFQASGDVTQEIGDFRFGAGTSFALFKFDEFFLEERERVRTYYGSIEWRPLPWLRPRVQYAYEKDDEDAYHVARFDLRITF